MKFTLEVAMDNAAFQNSDTEEPECYELSAILRKLADRIEDTTPSAGSEIRVMDSNGNAVGHYSFSNG